MQTRRDRLQAYRFGTRRSVSALVAGDPDAPEAPLRRVSGAIVAGVLLGALAIAAVGVYGALNPGGSTGWRDGRSLIVEKESRTRYVYVGGVLHPVLNFASARLVLGQSDLKVADVARASLGDTPRGLPVGIAGAPDALPAREALFAGAWTVCADPARTPAAAVVRHTRLVLGAPPPGLAAVAPDGALLASAPDGSRYLVWRGHRLRIDSTVVLSALGWSASQLLPVGAAWLDAVPAGPDLVPPAVPDRGRAVTIAGQDVRVGQVLLVSNVDTGSQYSVVRPDGLAPLSPLQAALLLGDPDTRQAYPSGAVAPVAVGAAVAAAAPRSATGTGAPPGLPDRVPRLVDAPADTTSVCATYARDAGMNLFTVTTAPATVDPATPVDPVAGTPIADTVTVPPTHGALVRSLPAPGVAGGTIYLVTDLGRKYPLPDTQVLSALGYPGAVPVPVPAGILQGIPTGPALDPAAASRTVTG